MLDLRHLRDYLDLKRRIAAAILEPASGFKPSARHRSEGLARSMEIAGERWTYSTAKGGYDFCAPGRRYRVFVAEDGARNQAFTPQEIMAYLRAFTAHGKLNQIVVDSWLLRAAIAGTVEQVEGLAGHWRLTERAAAAGAG